MNEEERGRGRKKNKSSAVNQHSASSAVGDDLLSTHALELMFDFPECTRVSVCVCLFEWGVILPPPAAASVR